LGLFGKVTPYIKPKRKVDVPRPDNFVFRLHYKVTFAILATSVILVSTYSYIDSSGSAIQCLYDKGTGIPQDVINRYCWIMSTFTLPKHYEGQIGEDFLHYGVGSHKDKDERVYHAYYQWVPLMLSFQALMFYAPHWIWKQLEGGRLKNIVSGLNVTIFEETDRSPKVEKLAGYMKERMAERRSIDHKIWAFKFFFCEALNFVNVILQILITDAFLAGEFSKYGTEVLQFHSMEPEARVDPMSRVFPRMTKCIFYKYGGSGTIQRIDSLCVLSMNILNEKIYIFLWFWFIVLALITGINLLVRLVTFFYPNFRERMVQMENLGHVDHHGKVRKIDIEAVVSRLSYSDWLILYYLAQVMEKANFGALMAKLADDLPDYPYRDDEDEDDDEIEQGKSITPPPGFDEANSENSPSRSATLKLKSKFSFRKERS